MTGDPCKRLNVSWAGGLVLRTLTSQKHFATPPPARQGGGVGWKGRP